MIKSIVTKEKKTISIHVFNYHFNSSFNFSIFFSSFNLCLYFLYHCVYLL